MHFNIKQWIKEGIAKMAKTFDDLEAEIKNLHSQASVDPAVTASVVSAVQPKFDDLQDQVTKLQQVVSDALYALTAGNTTQAQTVLQSAPAATGTDTSAPAASASDAPAAPATGTASA